MTLCPDYPVTGYSLVLEDSDGNRTVHFPTVSGNLIYLVVEDLREDTVYHFYIEAQNQFGSSSGFIPVKLCE